MHLCVFDPYYNKFNKFFKNGPYKKNLEKKKKRRERLNTEKQTQRGKDGLVKTRDLKQLQAKECQVNGHCEAGKTKEAISSETSEGAWPFGTLILDVEAPEL